MLCSKLGVKEFSKSDFKTGLCCLLGSSKTVLKPHANRAQRQGFNLPRRWQCAARTVALPLFCVAPGDGSAGGAHCWRGGTLAGMTARTTEVSRDGRAEEGAGQGLRCERSWSRDSPRRGGGGPPFQEVLLR